MKTFLLRKEIIGLLWIVLAFGGLRCSSGGSPDVEEAVDQEQETSQEASAEAPPESAEEDSKAEDIDDETADTDEVANEDIDSYAVGQENNIRDMEKAGEPAATQEQAVAAEPLAEAPSDAEASTKENTAVEQPAPIDETAQQMEEAAPVEVGEVDPEPAEDPSIVETEPSLDQETSATVADETHKAIPHNQPKPHKQKHIAATKTQKKSHTNHQRSATPATGEGRYITQPGDSLSAIAARLFGHSGRWQELASMSNISNPSKIFPGDVIRFPVTTETKTFDSAYNGIKMKTVQVQKGDSLSSISKRVLGTASAWKYVWRFNEDSIANPDKIEVGMTISYISRDQMTAFAPKAKKASQKTH